MSTWTGSDVNLVVTFPGVGLLSSRIKGDADEVTLRLAPQVPIRGRLLTPSGVPAAGVRVVLDNFYDGESEGMGFDSRLPDDQIPAYWPRPRTTDADGRFTLEGVPEGTYAQLEFQHPDYANDDGHRQRRTRGGLKAMLSAFAKGFEIAPVKPDFTHTLEPARPVQGRVTDKATGKPLAGLVVEMIPMRRHGGIQFYTRTDADGRYRVAGHQADHYITTVFPSAESGYLSVKDWQTGWPAGAKYLEKDFALTKGRIVHGKVIDAGTKRPIAGAAVDVSTRSARTPITRRLRSPQPGRDRRRGPVRHHGPARPGHPGRRDDRRGLHAGRRRCGRARRSRVSPRVSPRSTCRRTESPRRRRSSCARA